jgi:hypothetical protein
VRIEETIDLNFLDDDGNIQDSVKTNLKFERAYNWEITKAAKKVLISF